MSLNCGLIVMKSKTSLFATAALFLMEMSNSGAAVVFSQDFASGGVVSDYVNASNPDNGQWNALGTSGAAKTWSVSSGALLLSSTNTGTNSAYAARTTDFSTVPVAAKLTFDLELASSATALTSAVQFLLGSGFDGNNSLPGASTVHSKFGLNFTDANSFSVRDVSGSTNGAGTFTVGSHQITFVTNNSGGAITYLAPDGTTETVADDTWDLWVGNSRQLNDRAATTGSVVLTDFKFGSTSNANFALRFDNIQISAIPELSSALLGSFGLLGLLRRRR